MGFKILPAFCLVAAGLLCFICCHSGTKPPDPPKPTNRTGKELAETYCSGCHLFPAPDLLDKTTWQKGVLPEMAYRLGLRPFTDKVGNMDIDELRMVLSAGSYPDGPVIAQEDFQKIVAYYVQNAPDKPLPQAAKAPVKMGLPFFEVRSLAVPEGYLPMVTMVKIDTIQGGFYAYRRDRKLLERYDKSMHKIDSLPMESPLTDLYQESASDFLALQIGIMEPNDSRKGKLTLVNARQPHHILDSLQRPVQLTVADLNRDGTPDYLICNYGNETGRLAWYDGKTKKEHVLKIAPGARNTLISDLNGDGLPDILVLMCQARERISVFYNRGNDQFDEQVLLEFPPVYGSSFMTLADMNGDGKPDILYTNGDNADYSYSLKRYHGLRIFLNDGQNHFAEQFFYPIHGAGKVIVTDFNGDGRPDLAVSAVFTDPSQQPNEGFLFFENKGNMTFDVSTFAAANQGKWLVMDVGDVDRDGRPDIVLGSFMRPGLGHNTEASSTQPLSLVWLRNTRPAKRK